MPELPEVEIVRQSLNKKIKQKKVKKVIIRNRNLRLKIPSNFTSHFLNKKIIKVGRFSKYLIIYLPKDNYCLIHLGMSGTIHIINNKLVNTLLKNFNDEQLNELYDFCLLYIDKINKEENIYQAKIIEKLTNYLFLSSRNRDEPKLVSSLPNPIGKIPAVILYNQRSPMRGIGVSDLTDVVDLQKGIYNELSEIEQIIPGIGKHMDKTGTEQSGRKHQRPNCFCHG